ncbi:MAG: type II secretion system protein [Dehalococcoidia bacterium]|nr:MAG: type II secretion system protein [Dehalococcoidia bacterium]
MFNKVTKFFKHERGVSLVETIIALGILGLIATVFTMAIFVAMKSIMIADEKTNADSLARAQMEYIKQQEYIYDDIQAEYLEFIISGTQYSEGTPYSIMSVDRNGITVDEIFAVPWNSENGLPANEDVGLQKIILKIFRGENNEILTLEGYKVDAGVY